MIRRFNLGMKSIISKWVADIPQSGIREIYHEALELENVIHLEIGDPDFSTPREIIDAAYEALLKGYTHYTHNAGLPELREAISEYYSRRYGVYFDPEKHIIVTLGSTEGLFLTLLAVLEPGEEVLIPDPGYPSYISMIKSARGTIARYKLRERENFRINASEVVSRISRRTKVVIVNNPHNPTGSITPLATLREIARAAYEEGAILVADEVYENIVFDGITFHSIAEAKKYSDNVVIVNSLSKTFAMTGLRIGFVLSTNEELIRTMVRMQEGVASCAPASFQVAAARALREYMSLAAEMTKEYERRRDELIKVLRDFPEVSFVKPEGTFYLFLNVSEFTADTRSFAKELLREERVAVAPGSAFGPNGEGYVRLSYATSVENVVEGAKRLVRYLQRIKRRA